MYTFKDNIDVEEYNLFYKQYSKAPIMQDYAWALLKDNWNHFLCGLYKDDKLIATALILIKKLPFNYCLFYIPRGYLMDFTDKEALLAFTKHIRELSKKKKAYVVKIDPYISFYEKRVNPLTEDEHYHFYSDNVDIIVNNLKEAGYIHGGFKKEINAYLQPRYTMVVPLIDDKGEFITDEQFIKSLKKNTRNYLGDYHDKRGVIFSYSTDPNDVDILIDIIHHTEARQNIALRSKTYFKKMMKVFGDRAILFFGKVDINKYLDYIDEALKDPKTDKDFHLKQREIALSLKETKGDIITSSAAIVVLPSNEEGIRMAEFLYAGNDTSIFPNLKVNNGLTYYRLVFCLNQRCHYANLGGVDGSLTDHLSEFKSKFNPLVLEFIGEYDLPIHKIIYTIINKSEPLIKRIYKLIRRR